MGSRWQANKVGLINFWYYDEQEFPFVKGRMLLRGSNGSGKSVTMQSVIPLLLDGNLSPERLDPFGSRDRKMSSYLLEEDDGREERTGYLYLEFKRQESETYLTVGMGIRARRGKPMDKWYFSLTDGRRVGKDFYLYKETHEKITLSKKELENRIQGGGQMFDRQSEYMEYVNRQIFGFETVDEYKEMIDLLIQLRTPKLSKDFKPSVINEILSDSLRPLSDEELRPMAEAIENMDTMNLNLKARREGKQAAEKIYRVFDQYNRFVLFEKTENLLQNRKALASLRTEQKHKEKQARECEADIERLETDRMNMDAKKSALEKERESLNKSDALALKEREMELSSEMKDLEERLREKEGQLGAKQEQYVQLKEKKKAGQDQSYEKEQELLGILEDMQSEADEMAFEEHAFFQEELKGQFQEPFSFQTHQSQLEQTQERIAQGLEILRESDVRQKGVEELLLRRERQQREEDAAQRRVSELEGVLVQVENEWKEKLYGWSRQNQELLFPQELLKSFAQFADSYNEQSDFSEVRQKTADLFIEKKSVLSSQLQKDKDGLSELEEQYRIQEEELKEWENHKEPEPPRSDAVQKNRERLQKMGISYQEFYKVIEFDKGIDRTACDRLEEALLQMGILDALVIDEAFKEQVLAADPGCCDRYLFVQDGRAQRSVLDVLNLEDSFNDIFFNQRITGILSNIAYGCEGTTAILPDGTYQLGVLTGTVTGEYEAGFIGAWAREQNRQAKIQACREQMELLNGKMEEFRQKISSLEERLKRLEEEYQAFPSDQDMRTALRMLQDVLREKERLQEERIRLEAQIREENEALKSLRQEALQIAQKLYLTCNYETFLRADAAARKYGKYFSRLQYGHELYLQILENLRGLEERMEDLDMDMEQIRYDMGNTEKMLKKDQEERQSVMEQLKLTDYEEIKERLEFCVQWLNAYPGKMQACVGEQAGKKEQVKQLRQQIEEGMDSVRKCERKEEYLSGCYQAEAELGYVELTEEMAGDIQKLKEFLSADCKELQKETLLRNLNQVYFENRGFLNDYQLTQAERFAELEEQAEPGDPRAKRLDIYARYQGVRIPFGKLLDYLDEEIENLQELIKAGDRELFEDILANTVSRKIRGKINGANTWVAEMNRLMSGMNTSSGLKLSMRWRSRTAEKEDQMDTKELVDLLKKDYRLMTEGEAAKLSMHFRSKVEEARRHARDSGGMVSFYQIMKETLDYRKWFEFQLFSQKIGERQKELTNSVFGTFSGGEKAMSMYVPLFSAVTAKYQGIRDDAPKLISLDEAFAGVDNKNLRDMFRLMTEFEFDFIINSQVLWGDCDTLDALAVYQLLRPGNARFVTVMPYLWNGRVKELVEDEAEIERRKEELEIKEG